MQALFGVFPSIQAKGTGAKMVLDMLIRMRREQGLGKQTVPAEIDSLIILDREVDLVTPMLTQMTYEGLIDELLGVANGYVELEPAVAGVDKAPPGRLIKHPLNSNDTLFADVRDLNFVPVANVLRQKAVQLQSTEESRHAAQSVSQIKDFVKKLGSLQTEKKALQVHINVAEEINKKTQAIDFNKRFQVEQALAAGEEANMCAEYIEEAALRQVELLKLLRLACLSSLTTNGMKTKNYEALKREVLQSYGFSALFTLQNLEKVGLLRRNGGPPGLCANGNWSAV